jgi:hypothetical protein
MVSEPRFSPLLPMHRPGRQDPLHASLAHSHPMPRLLLTLVVYFYFSLEVLAPAHKTPSPCGQPWPIRPFSKPNLSSRPSHRSSTSTRRRRRLSNPQLSATHTSSAHIHTAARVRAIPSTCAALVHGRQSSPCICPSAVCSTPARQLQPRALPAAIQPRPSGAPPACSLTRPSSNRPICLPSRCLPLHLPALPFAHIQSIPFAPPRRAPTEKP